MSNAGVAMKIADRPFRVRYQVSGASPLNYSAECAKLTDLIKLYSMA